MNSDEQSILKIAQNIFHNIGFLHWIDRIQKLYNQQIYFDICKIIFPNTIIKLFKISQSKLTTGQKIQQLINLLSNQIHMDLSHIQGIQIAHGNINHLYHLLQLFQQFSNYYLIRNQGKGALSVKSAPQHSQIEKQDQQNNHTVLAIHKQFRNIEQQSQSQQQKDSMILRPQQEQINNNIKSNENPAIKLSSKRKNKEQSDDEIQILAGKGFPKKKQQKIKKKIIKQRKEENEINNKQNRLMMNVKQRQLSKGKNNGRSKSRVVLVGQKQQFKEQRKNEQRNKELLVGLGYKKIRYLEQINKIVLQLQMLKMRDVRQYNKRIKEGILRDTELRLNNLRMEDKVMKKKIHINDRLIDEKLGRCKNNNKKIRNQIKKQFKKQNIQQRNIIKKEFQYQNQNLLKILKDQGTLQNLIIDIYKDY